MFTDLSSQALVTSMLVQSVEKAHFLSRKYELGGCWGYFIFFRGKEVVAWLSGTNERTNERTHERANNRTNERTNERNKRGNKKTQGEDYPGKRAKG